MKAFLEKVDVWASYSLNMNDIIQQAGRSDGIKVVKRHQALLASSTFLEQRCLLLLPLPVDIRLHHSQSFHVALNQWVSKELNVFSLRKGLCF